MFCVLVACVGVTRFTWGYSVFFMQWEVSGFLGSQGVLLRESGGTTSDRQKARYRGVSPELGGLPDRGGPSELAIPWSWGCSPELKFCNKSRRLAGAWICCDNLSITSKLHRLYSASPTAWDEDGHTSCSASPVM